MGEAWVAAFALVSSAIVASVIGPVVVKLISRKSADDDLDVVKALAAALAAEVDARRECEARERARRQQ